MNNAIDDEISNIIERGRVIKVDPVIQVLNIARLKELYEEKNKGSRTVQKIKRQNQIKTGKLFLKQTNKINKK